MSQDNISKIKIAFLKFKEQLGELSEEQEKIISNFRRQLEKEKIERLRKDLKM